jgi:hypothetical protein
VPGGVAAGCAAAPNGCPAADFNHDGCLRASELTRIVNNVLIDADGCPAMSGTAAPARRSAGVVQSSASAFLILPRVVGAILGPVASFSGGGGGGATSIIDVPVTCPTSGGGNLKCDQDFTGTGFSPRRCTRSLTNQ